MNDDMVITHLIISVFIIILIFKLYLSNTVIKKDVIQRSEENANSH